MNIDLIKALRLIVLKESEELAKNYETSLFQADEKRKADKKRYETEVAPQVNILKAELKTISDKIKKAEVSEKAVLGNKIKEINSQISELQQPTINHFSVLDNNIKGYASSIFMLKELVKEETLKEYNIPHEFDEDGKLIVDYGTLKESELGSKILETSDYIFNKINEYGAKVTQPSDIKGIIKSDYAKYFFEKINSSDSDEVKAEKQAQRQAEYDNIVLDFDTIARCKRAYDEELAEIAQRQKSLERRINDSKSNVEILKEYPNGQFIVELLPGKFTDDNGQEHHTSLSFESDEMGHCVGRGGYDSVIGQEGYKFYSLRSYNKEGVFEPHCTISIENGSLRQIKGKSNLSVKARYVDAVRDFVGTLNMSIPSSEKQLIGYVNDTSGKEVDIYNLKDITSLDTLNYASGDSKYIDVSKIKSLNKLIFDDTPTISDFKTLKTIENIETITLENIGKKSDSTLLKLFKLEDLPDTKRGISCPKWGDASGYSMIDILRKVHGSKADIFKEKDGIIYYNGNMSLKDNGIIYPKDLKNVHVQNTLTIGGTSSFENLPKFNKLEIAVYQKEQEIKEKFLEKLPYSPEGIKYGFFGDLSYMPLKEVLTKIHGTKWADKNLKEKDGKLIINSDLDLAQYGITRLSDEFKNAEINGKLKLGSDYDRDNIPLTENGVSFSSEVNLEYMPLKDALTMLKGTKWADENLVIEDDKVARIKGDLDLSTNAVSYISDELYSVPIDGRFSANTNMALQAIPQCKIFDFTNGNYSLSKGSKLPDSVEEVFSSSISAGVLSLTGKNLKKVSIDYERTVELTPEDMQKMKPEILYKGNFKASNSAHYGYTRDMNFTVDHVDMSKINIDGEFTVIANFEDIKWLPNAKSINIQSNNWIKNEALKDIKQGVETFKVSDAITSLEYLKDNTNLKELEISVDGNIIDLCKSVTNFDIIYNIKASNLDMKNLFDAVSKDDDYTSLEEPLDFSKIKIKELDINKKIESIKNLPQAERLITHYGNNLSPDFLKDLTPFTTYLSVYDVKDVDLSVLPKDSELKTIRLSGLKDKDIKRDLLKYLPKTIENINLFDVRPQDLTLIKDLPNLKTISWSHMGYASNAIDKISVEDLKRVELECSYENPDIYSRRQEIISIHDAPSNEVNDKLKTMNKWLCKDDDKRKYLYRKLAFYKLGTDIIDGKYKGEVSDNILNENADRFKDIMLKSCSEVIMARELARDDKSERSVIGMLKDKKVGYYKRVGKSRRGTMELMKAIVSRKIEKHPDFVYANSEVEKRLSIFSLKLQNNFAEKLAEATNSKAHKMESYDLKNTSFNNLMKDYGRNY